MATYGGERQPDLLRQREEQKRIEELQTPISSADNCIKLKFPERYSDVFDNYQSFFKVAYQLLRE